MDLPPLVTLPRRAPRPEHRPPAVASPVRRVWLRGLAAADGRQPVRRLAADLAGTVGGLRVEFAGWEFSRAERAAQPPLPVARATARWSDPRTGEVRAGLVLRELPSGDERGRTCEWAVAADCEHGWRYDVPSPCSSLGLAGQRFSDRSGASILDEAMIWAPEDEEPDGLDALLAIIDDPDRAVALFVISAGTGAVEAVAHALWPGLVSLAIVSEEGRAVLNERLPRRAIPRCGGRYFPAVWDTGATEEALGTTVAGRRSTYERLVNRVLALRAKERPLGIAADAAALLPAPADQADAAADAVAPADLGARLRRLEDDLAEARRERTDAQRALERAEQGRDAALARAERLAAELAAARAAAEAEAADPERARLARRLAEALADRDVFAQALEIAEEERDLAVRERGLLAVRLARAEAAAPRRPGSSGPGSDDAAAFPADFAELLRAAADRFPRLLLDDLDTDATAALDSYPKAMVWCRRTWDALATLDAYAAAKLGAADPCRAEQASGAVHGCASGHHCGCSGHQGSAHHCGTAAAPAPCGAADAGAAEDPAVPRPTDVLAFIRAGGPGTMISANIVALSESENVNADPRYRTARMFPVRPETRPSGRAYFPAHIKIDGPRPPAPRLHFYDDTDGATRRIYVGYIGPHLPTSRTN